MVCFLLSACTARTQLLVYIKENCSHWYSEFNQEPHQLLLIPAQRSTNILDQNHGFEPKHQLRGPRVCSTVRSPDSLSYIGFFCRIYIGKSTQSTQSDIQQAGKDQSHISDPSTRHYTGRKLPPRPFPRQRPEPVVEHQLPTSAHAHAYEVQDRLSPKLSRASSAPRGGRAVLTCTPHQQILVTPDGTVMMEDSSAGTSSIVTGSGRGGTLRVINDSLGEMVSVLSEYDGGYTHIGPSGIALSTSTQKRKPGYGSESMEGPRRMDTSSEVTIVQGNTISNVGNSSSTSVRVVSANDFGRFGRDRRF